MHSPSAFAQLISSFEGNVGFIYLNPNDDRAVEGDWEKGSLAYKKASWEACRRELSAAPRTSTP
jgi:hypothetical protein